MSADVPTQSQSPLRRALRAWPFLLLAVALALWTFQGPGGTRLADGVAAPALNAPWTEPGALDLSAERGHVVVLAFWATWCPACRAEGPTLARLHQRIAPAGDRVVGVSVDRGTLPAIARAARQLGMTYPIALGAREDLDRFAVELLPTIYVVGADGRIARSFVGGVGERALLEAVEAARRSD